MNIQFLGAAGTVTGSRFLVDTGRTRLLVDCGLFQGLKSLRLKNREPFPVPPKTITAVVLTHAHLDHSGWLPLLIRSGYDGPVYASPGTIDLCRLLLPDSGHLLEEEALFANRHKYSKHDPALPLYTREEAEASLQSLVPLTFGDEITIDSDLTVKLQRAGHLLGAAGVKVSSSESSVFFSGDVGRNNDPILPPPAPPPAVDFMVLESTYGNRTHSPIDALTEVAAAINRASRRGGTIVVPSFAVGRTQALLYLIHQLRKDGRISILPIFVDSPMATSATELYLAHQSEHRLSQTECRALHDGVQFTRTVEESKSIDQRTGPMIIISASGMATGGRVLFHLERFASDPKNIILFTGFQAAATRGAPLLAGERTLRVHGKDLSIRAEVRQLVSLSAHADANELISYVSAAARPPEHVFVVHGERDASEALARRITKELGIVSTVPAHGAQMELRACSAHV